MMTFNGRKCMSWINDVRGEVHRLKCTPKELQKFAYLVGSVLIIIGGGGIFKHWHFFIIAGIWITAAILLFCGIFSPRSLRRVYVAWMGVALALGWIVSRAILVLLFYFVITPIRMVAQLFGKKFIDIDFSRVSASYWVERGSSKKIDYEKMF